MHIRHARKSWKLCLVNLAPLFDFTYHFDFEVHQFLLRRTATAFHLTFSPTHILSDSDRYIERSYGERERRVCGRFAVRASYSLL
jgi:hypothetical protein